MVEVSYDCYHFRAVLTYNNVTSEEQKAFASQFEVPLNLRDSDNNLVRFWFALETSSLEISLESEL